ncbi:MAG: SxtJ family membrane protein [Acidobacteriota bacterium]
MATPVSKQERRKFGLVVGALFCVIGLWPLLWRGHPPRWWAVAPGLALAIAGLLAPMVLGPLYRVWMGLAQVLGWINTRIVLGLVYFALITPTAMVLRLLGKDPLNRCYDKTAKTYRVPAAARSDLRRPF